MRVIGIDALKDGLAYVRDNPMVLVRAAANTARLRIGIPVAALGWLVAHLSRGTEVEFRALSPALGVRARVPVMGTELQVSAAVYAESVQMDREQLLLTARVKDLLVEAPPDSPIAMMLMAVDLSKPGNLMAVVPVKVPALVEARDDQFAFDLLALPRVRNNAVLRRVLAALSEVISIKEVSTAEDMLVISLRTHLRGLPAALLALGG